jgi:hypothetical protein
MRRLVWVLNLVLLAGIGYFAYWTYAYVPPPLAAAPAAVTAEPNAPHVAAVIPPPPPREEYKLIEDMNLFNQARSPVQAIPPAPTNPAALAPPQPPPENPLDRYALYGIVRIGQARYRALIKDKKTANAKTLSYNVGDTLPTNQVIKRIDDKRVTLVGLGGSEVDLKLRGSKGADDTGFVPRPVAPAAPPSFTPPIIQPPGQQANRPGLPAQPGFNRMPGGHQQGQAGVLPATNGIGGQPVQPRVLRPEPGRRPIAPPPVIEEDNSDEEYPIDEGDSLDMGDEE